MCCCVISGTGKTTFIKALATHTRRSIINIPLSRIKTNQQLMDMMMDEKIKVNHDGWYTCLCHTYKYAHWLHC